MIPFSEALPDASEDEVAKLEQLFPDAPCPLKPCGGWVVVQDRLVLKKIGSIILTDLSREDKKLRETVARVVKIGPIAGWEEILADFLPGWPWFQPGQFVKLSPHSSTRTEADDDEGKVVHRQIHYKDVLAQITSVREVLR